MGKNIQGMDKYYVAALKNHQWKGEVRELENIVERGMIFAEGQTLSVNELPESVLAHGDHFDMSTKTDLGSALNNFEKNHIYEELSRQKWDKKKTSEELGISLSSLYRKMEQFNINSQS